MCTLSSEAEHSDQIRLFTLHDWIHSKFLPLFVQPSPKRYAHIFSSSRCSLCTKALVHKYGPHCVSQRHFRREVKVWHAADISSGQNMIKITLKQHNYKHTTVIVNQPQIRTHLFKRKICWPAAHPQAPAGGLYLHTCQRSGPIY